MVEDSLTIAVVAGGVDIVYPREHGELYQHLIDRVVVAEMPLGMQPTARHFLPEPHHRGIAAATVVVEAAERSGSLITVRYAADFSREVVRFPAIHSTSRGWYETAAADGAAWSVRLRTCSTACHHCRLCTSPRRSKPALSR